MTPRTKQQNEEIRKQTRQQILDAAFELFAQEGYAKTGISAIAQKADVSKGLIYHYFESKEAILGGIFDYLAHIGDEILDFPEGFTPADKIARIVEQTFAFIEQQTGLGKLMISLSLQPDTMKTLQPKIDKVNKSQMTLYIQLLEELGYEDAEIEAYKFGALMDGILLGYASMGDDYPLEAMKTKIMEEYVPC